MHAKPTAMITRANTAKNASQLEPATTSIKYQVATSNTAGGTIHPTSWAKTNHFGFRMTLLLYDSGHCRMVFHLLTFVSDDRAAPIPSSSSSPYLLVQKRSLKRKKEYTATKHTTSPRQRRGGAQTRLRKTGEW